jgi:hypothetical protein
MDKATIDAVPIWFLKEIWGVHGKGITLIHGYDDYLEKLKSVAQKPTFLIGPDGKREEIPDTYFLQAGLPDPHLIDGRKYCLRVFFLTIGDGRTYVYGDALGYIHMEKFQKDATDWHSHISHYKIWEGEADKRKYILASNEPWFDEVMGNIVSACKKHSRLFSDTVALSRAPGGPNPLNAKHYQIWGSDYLVMEDKSVSLIEINAFPNLNHDALRQGAHASQGSGHEMLFREKGFDRDL